MSTGLHARRATGLTVAEREENLTGTESVARWSPDGRAAYEAKREALMFDFFLSDRCKVFKSGRNYYMRVDGGFFYRAYLFVFILIVKRSLYL